jgi:hypothetical protein
MWEREENHIDRMGVRLDIFSGKVWSEKRDFWENMVKERINFLMQEYWISEEEALISLNITKREKDFFWYKNAISIWCWIIKGDISTLKNFFFENAEYSWKWEELEMLFNQMNTTLSWGIKEKIESQKIPLRIRRILWNLWLISILDNISSILEVKPTLKIDLGQLFRDLSFYYFRMEENVSGSEVIKKIDEYTK